jgi:hypothetical protein
VIRHIHARDALDLYKKLLAPIKYEVGWAPDCLDPCENSIPLSPKPQRSNYINAALGHHFIRDINNTVENF